MSTAPSSNQQTGGLRTRAAGAVRWTATSTAVTTLVQFGQLAFLGRLLDPSAFGVIAAAGTISGLAGLFTDAGLANAVVQRRDIPHHTLSSLFWMNTAVGLVVGLVVLCVGGLVAEFYDMPALTDLFKVMWATFVITSFAQIQQALLQKELKFRGVAVAEIASIVVHASVSVSLAASGSGPVCFAWGLLAGTSARVLVLWTAAWRTWRPSLHFAWGEVKSYVSFAAFQLGERLTNFLAANTDYILVGKLLGAAQLGVYSVAYQLVVLPLTKLNPVLNRVAFPVFAMRQDDDDALGRGYREVSKIIAYVTVPVLVLLAVSAPITVPLVMGEQWADAATLVRILAVLGLVRSLGNPAGSVLLTKAHADWAFYWNVGALVTNAAVLGTSVQLGIVPMAVAFSVLSVVQWAVMQSIVGRLIGMKIGVYLCTFRTPALAGMTTLAGALMAWHGLPLVGVEGVLSLFGTLAVGVLLYVGLTKLLEPGLQIGLFRQLFGRLGDQ